MRKTTETDTPLRRQSRRKSSIGAQIMPGPSAPYQPSPRQSDENSQASDISFKHWHRRMQIEHELLEQSGRKGFRLWKWCNVTCKPCRWFDSIGYEVKICKCCFTFKTFKLIGTIVLIAVFIYVFLFSLLKEELLPGGTVFFLFMMFLAGYAAGVLLTFIGLPPMIGYLVVGMIARHFPTWTIRDEDMSRILGYAKTFEKILLVLALVRAGLLLDLSRIKGHVQFILGLSFLPLLAEFLVVMIVTHYANKMPWGWSSIQGSILGIVSLASVTTIMEKNKHSGYGEDKNLATVLIAASASNVTFGFLFYVICSSITFSDDTSSSTQVWNSVFPVLIQCGLGLITGIVCGILVAYFPDKRSSEAAGIRILLIGTASFALASIFNTYNMMAAGVLSALTMCLVASNMWEEMGWHEKSNPVTYFYSIAYYFSQPVALSLVGYSIDFSEGSYGEVGMSFVVSLSGIAARGIVCYLVTLTKIYPTTNKEKIFICIAWLSKGTFQALLAYAIDYLNTKRGHNAKNDINIEFDSYKRIIVHTTVIAILLTTPVAYYSLTLLSSKLLVKKESVPRAPRPSLEEPG